MKTKYSRSDVSNHWMLNSTTRQLPWCGPGRRVKAQNFAYTLFELLIVMAILLIAGCWLLRECITLSKPLDSRPMDGYNGGFAGIGVQLEKDNQSGAIMIAKVAADSSAATAKLSAGLIVQKINGAPTCGKTLTECRLLMWGIEGSKVRLDLVDSHGNEMKVVELTRES